MASIGNYASALAEAARKSVKSSATGIGAAIKGAAFSEMPGVTSAYSFAQNLKNNANSKTESGGGNKGGGGAASSSSSSDSSNFNAAVVRELQLMNENILEQTRLLRYQVDSAKTKSQYDEENAREQALRDSKLLDAINNLGSKGGGKGGGGEDGNDGGLLDKLGGVGGVVGGRGGRSPKRRGSVAGKLVKGAGAVGLGLGALYAYDRVANGGESIAGVAKDLAPGAIGATVGGLIGMIGGPIGVAIGSAIGGAIGDSDFGRKMFEKILPDLENYGKILSQKFGEVSASVTKIFDDFVPTFNNIKNTVTSSFTTATDYVVSAFGGITKSVESSFGEVKNWFTNLKFPDFGLGQVTRDPKLAKQVNAEMNAPANQAGNILGNVPNPMGGKAAKQAAMRAANASSATTSVVPAATAIPFVTPVATRSAAAPVENESQAPSTVTGASDRAIDFIKKYEGKFQAKAYWDHKQWSIGYGTKANSKDEVITEEEGFARMKADINKSAKSVIDYGKKYAYNWNQNQVDALTSFVYNGGPGFLHQVTNNGKRSNEQISQALLLYNKASGEVSKGLVARRGAEKKLFDTSSISTPASGPGFNSARDSQAAYSTTASEPAKTPQSRGFNSARDSQVAYDAMPTTPVFAGLGFGSYKEGPNPEADTSFSGSNIPENPQLKVSPLTQKMEEVRVEIRKASNATIEVAKKIGKETANNFKDLAQSSARIARAVAPRNAPIRPILKTPEQIIAETNASFAKAFQKAVPKAFNLALRQALFPKGVGVSQQAAGGALFRGQQLNNIFGIGKNVNKLATSLFGKQYGGMFAPALNNLATGYLEAGARAGGRVLFGMIGGMGAEQSNILTGQILGNYARGNKKLATEQLIFGTTGVATGYESVFAKYGFKNPTEGVNYMANTLGAAVSDPLGRYMDPNAKASEWVDPRTRKKVSLNSTSSFTADAYGRYNVPSSDNKNNAAIGPTWTSGYDREPTVTSMPGGDNALTIVDPIAEEARKQTNDLLTQQNDQIAADAVRRATDAAEAKYVSQQGDQGIIGKLQEVITTISQGRVGSGSTAGGSLGFGGGGGGGFFGSGGPLANVGNMALDLGKVTATNAIYKALGGKGKNPYTAALANFAINQGLKYAGQVAYSAVFGNASFANAAGQTAGYISNAFGLGGAQAAAPIIDGTLAAGGSSLLGTAGAATGSSSMAGASAMATSVAQGQAAAGTIGAVAPSTTTAAGGGGMLAGLGEAAYALAMNPATWAVVAFVAFAAWMMGDDDDPPNPTIQRVLYVSGNNDIAKITTNWVFDIGALNQDQKMAWIAISDQLLRIAFNAAKAFEVKAGTLSTYIGAFEYLGTQINKWGVIIGFYNGTPKAPLPQSIDQIDFGTPEEFSKLNANEVARRIVKKVEELYKKGVTHDAKVTEELGKTAEALQKVNYKALGSGLLEATAKRLDTSISKTNYNMQPIEASNGYFVEDVGMTGGSPRVVWNEQTGTYVPVSDQPQYVDTGRTETVLGQELEVLTRPVYEWKTTGIQNIVGYDKQGRPIYDLNSDNKLTAEDFTTNLDAVKAVFPSATATTVGNYIANQSAATAATTAAAAASGGTSSATTGGTNAVVNSGNAVTNNNSSTTIIRRNDSLDVLRSASAQTAIPIG